MSSTAAPARLSSAAARVPSSTIRQLLSVTRSHDVLSLAGGIPDPALLPTDEVRSALAEVGRRTDALQYGPTQGEPELRAWIAEHELGGADPDRIVITQGAQQALSLVVDALVDPGDDVVVEGPTYVGMLQPLRRAGAVLHQVPVDRDGLGTLELAQRLRSGLRPALVYIVPTHQNPTGAVMSEVRRTQLGRLAAAHRVVVVDDDPYRRLGGPAPSRLRDHVPDELAVTVGSFSKIVAPGLRVGWLHGPDWLVDAVLRLKQSNDLHSGALTQLAVAQLVARDGWLDEHADRLTSIYRARAAALVDALRSDMGDRVRVDEPRGGMFAWATFDAHIGDTDLLARCALEEGVAFVPSSAFDPSGRPGHSARLGFATLAPDDLRRAARRLARAVRRRTSTVVAASSPTR